MDHRMRRVALIYDAKAPYDLKVISGISRYVQEGAEFNIYIEEDVLKCQKLPDLRSWHGDGILADFVDRGVRIFSATRWQWRRWRLIICSIAVSSISRTAALSQTLRIFGLKNVI